MNNQFQKKGNQERKNKKKREKHTITGDHLVAEEESLEELQGSEIFESDLGEEELFFFVKNYLKLKMM